MENKQKHLEFIQDLIERMSGHSFSLKRWCATLITTLLVLSTADKYEHALLISFIPVVIFWILDGFYLFKERLYRTLYENVRQLTESKIDYNMNTDEYVGGENTWVRSIFSKTLIIFYFTLILSISLVIVLIN